MYSTTTPDAANSISDAVLGVKSANLFPVFLKLEQFNVLIVGGGNLALEKLTALLQNSPATCITLVGREIGEEIKTFCLDFKQVLLKEKSFEASDLQGHQLALIATDDSVLNREIKSLAQASGILANIADTPDYSDFYLGSFVQKGDLNIAISSNGKSQISAQHLNASLQAAILDEMETHPVVVAKKARYWRTIATFSLIAFGILLLVNIITISGVSAQIPPVFWAFLVVGFCAQMIDGLLGMGYGLTSAIGLMAMNVSAAAVSSSIHTAEIFASGASGYSHYRFGNVNKALFRKLLIPGVIGAISGALLLSWLDGNGAQYVKPLVAAYTFLLGLRLLWRAFKPKHDTRDAMQRMGWLAGAGGFLDSFGGGGWGPLVTGTLISKGSTPRTVIGSVSLAEFFVTLASAMTFFFAIGISHWPVVLGLIVGGVLAAPLAARLVGILPVKTMTIGVGVMVIIWSLVILVRLLL